MRTENKLTVNHDLFISIGLEVPVNPETFREEIDTLLFENIGYMKSWGVHTSHEFLTLCNELIEERNRLRKSLEWASRIIGSGLDGTQLRYDPREWMVNYHNEWKEQPNDVI